MEHINCQLNQRVMRPLMPSEWIQKFKCWHQMAAMIFAQIRQEDSLRDIDMALNAHASKLYHIGIEQSPKSTLSDANERRDYRIYEDYAKVLMQRTRRQY